MSQWINVKDQLPKDGQQVYYFSPLLGIWRGYYTYSPLKYTVDDDGNKHPVPANVAALVSPHVFAGGAGCCDTDEVTHWQPYDKKHAFSGWVPLPPMYEAPEMAEARQWCRAVTAGTAHE